MRPVYGLSYMLGFIGLFWTFVVMALPRITPSTEEETRAIFGTLVIGALFTCTGTVLWSIATAVGTIIKCFEDDE